MTVAFQADADLNHYILAATIRREPTIDFQSAIRAGFSNLSDDQVLARAAEENRVLVPHDRKTMPAHFYRYIGENQSPGVIIIPQHLPIKTAVENLILIWHGTTADEWINRLLILPF
jgi:hypothetical protein